jgi:inner membrane organizing system protein 1
MAEPSTSVRSEDELGIKLDRCLADTILKTTGGAALGVIASFVLLKREWAVKGTWSRERLAGRTWPVWMGTGVGLGMGVSNCQHDLRSPYLLHGRKMPKDQVRSGRGEKLVAGARARVRRVDCVVNGGRGRPKLV